MRDTGPSERSAPGGVLTGWISRPDLALELDLTVDTLRRWDGMVAGGMLRENEVTAAMPKMQPWLSK